MKLSGKYKVVPDIWFFFKEKNVRKIIIFDFFEIWKIDFHKEESIFRKTKENSLFFDQFHVF